MTPRIIGSAAKWDLPFSPPAHAGLKKNTSTVRVLSSINTAAFPFSWRASSPLSAPLFPSSPALEQMRYGYFITYNVLGGIVWTALFSFGGYFFGNLPIVKEHLLVLIAIVVISVLPAIIEIVKSRHQPEEPVRPQITS